MDHLFWKIVLIVVLLGLIKPILRLLLFVLARTVFRGFLANVGQKAMDQQPDQIHLTPKSGHVWLDDEAVQSLANPLTSLGFEEAGTFGIEEMNAVVVRFLVRPGQGMGACIYEHPQVGTWLDLFSHFRDGTSLTYTTSRPTGLDARPGTKTVNAPEMDAESLYHRMLRERPATEVEEVTAANIVGIFEDAYAKTTAWRKNRGLSANEVARNIELDPVGAGASTQQPQ